MIGFVIEAMWNSDPVVASTPVSTFRIPAAASCSVSSANTATDAPGTRYFAIEAFSRACKSQDKSFVIV